jgi:hypothetical protein
VRSPAPSPSLRFAGHLDGSGSEFDLDYAVTLARSVNRDAAAMRNYMSGLNSSMQQLLTRRWPVVELLAGKLLEHQEMSGAEVSSLLRSLRN